VTAILVPVIGWLLNSTGLNRKQKQVAYFMQRLELLEKLRAFHGESDIAKRHYDIEREIDDIILFLKAMPITVEESEGISDAGITWLQKSLLVYKPNSLKGWIYHILFYIFALGTLSGLPLIIEAKEYGAGIFVSLFYLFVALIVRRAARRVSSTQQKT